MYPIVGGDHRAVPLEVLRDFVRSQAELTSIRHVVEDAGVGRSTLHQFISSGTTPHPRIRRLLGLWYLRRLAGLDEVDLLRPYFAALDVLLGGAVELVREGITLDLLRAVETRFGEAGQDPPHWVGVMRSRVTRVRPVL